MPILRKNTNSEFSLKMNINFKKWITGSILLIALVGITPWIVGWRMQCVAQRISHDMSPLATASTDSELKLTPTQKEQIAKLEEKYTHAMRAYCTQHCSAKLKIGQALEKDPLDQGALLLLGKQVGDAYSASEQDTLKLTYEISQILTPEQKTVFLKKISQRISASCPKEFIQ
jgi:Spy/CpxP family protein refolding chaperone